MRHKNDCYGNAGCLATELKIMGFMTSWATYCSIANISNWCTCSPRDPGDVTILRYVIYPLAIINEVIMPIVNAVML